MVADFDPSKYHDEYRERVMELIEPKARGEKVVTQPAVTERRGRVINLMEALQASLAETRKRRPAAAAVAARTTSTARKKAGGGKRASA